MADSEKVTGERGVITMEIHYFHINFDVPCSCFPKSLLVFYISFLHPSFELCIQLTITLKL
jgi:hypothetical protein